MLLVVNRRKSNCVKVDLFFHIILIINVVRLQFAPNSVSFVVVYMLRPFQVVIQFEARALAWVYVKQHVQCTTSFPLGSIYFVPVLHVF